MCMYELKPETLHISYRKNVHKQNKYPKSLRFYRAEERLQPPSRRDTRAHLAATFPVHRVACVDYTEREKVAHNTVTGIERKWLFINSVTRDRDVFRPKFPLLPSRVTRGGVYELL